MTDPVVPAAPPALPGGVAIALVAGTSASVLVLEILAGRLLAPYVGVSLETYTGIIGTILAGIALGAWAGGALADRVDPHRLLPVLLMLGGAFAIATIPIVRLIGESGASDGSTRIVLLSACGFLPAATVLSGVPPAVIKLQLRDLTATGSTVGRLSAWSTAGAIFGTFFTGFVLVAAAAVTTLIVGVGTLLVVAGGAMGIAARRRGIGANPNDHLSLAGVAVMSLAGVFATQSPCDVQTAYYCLAVRADVGRDATHERGRTLVLDDLRHSYVDLDDPTHLEYWYVRRLVDAIELEAPATVVYLGGGALTIPRYVRATAPETRQTVLEIDGDLIDVVVEEMGYTPSGSIDIVIGDARLSIDDLADDSADVVIGDAFGSRSVPFHLATTEFVENVERVLTADGLYAVNVIDAATQKFLAAEAATIGRVFDHTLVMRGPAIVGGRNGNSVILASQRPIDRAAIEARRIAAGDEGEIIADLAAFTAGVRILTDDFAPVDQLIAAGG